MRHPESHIPPSTYVWSFYDICQRTIGRNFQPRYFNRYTDPDICTDIYYSSDINTDEGSKTVYVAIAPGTYTGFNLHIYNEDGDEKSITKSGSVTFEAGKIYDLGSYDLNDL